MSNVSIYARYIVSLYSCQILDLKTVENIHVVECPKPGVTNIIILNIQKISCVKGNSEVISLLWFYRQLFSIMNMTNQL